MDIERFFTDPSCLPASLPGYRTRPVQIKAAEIIAGSFDNFQNAVIEAPTGSGKTMAYLIPAFYSGRKITVATKTKQLMSQILSKDVPAVKKFLGSELSVKILKGRKNYFCPNRFFRLVIPNAGFYADAVSWYEESLAEGITEAPWGRLDNDVCNLMTADRFQCCVSKCPYFYECPFYSERQEANAADVVITNHHLLLSDLAMKASGAPGGIFDFRDHCVFDEAHSVPDIFSQYAGSELSLFGLAMFFRENREKLGPAETESLMSGYFELLSKVKEGRVLYKTVSDGVKKLVDACSEAIARSADSDLEEEFGRYVSSFKEINGEKEGLRVAERNDKRLTVKFVPLESGHSFIAGLKESFLSAVFISATVSAGGGFEYFMSETGLEPGETLTEALPAAFDFKKQARLYVPAEKECARKDELYLSLVGRMPGSVLVICNSIERMWRVGELLKSAVKNKTVTFQTGLDVSSFDRSRDTVLVGCALLREGIDLSGAGFGCVIIDKLPFEYFGDFYLQSKAEKVEKERGNAFMNFYLPRAVLYFKQAAGRLIRHEDDRGIWAVLDSRIVSKSYGKYFLDVLDNVDIVNSTEEALEFALGGRL